ncbi:MAG: ABC transporter substrate-binding protein [Acetobacteraceae bacterium]
MRVPLLLACLLAASAASAQTLRVGMRDDPDVLDPTFSRTYVGTLVMTSMCDKLFDFDAKQALVPVLATGYEWVNPTTLLIRLRDGVQFQNGEAFDAAAVKYTLERHATAQGSFRRNDIGAMDRVEVVDPLTVRVLLKSPFSPFVAVLTDRAGMMVAPKAAQAAGKDFGLAPVCVGPFRFLERVAQDRVVLERDPTYWDASRVHFDRIVYRVIPDSSIRLANLKAGALEAAEVAPLDVQAVKADANLQLISVPSLGYGSLTINLSGTGPLARDARVRAALQAALDRDALNQVVFAGMYRPTAQAISAASPFHAKQVPMPAHDPARAKALLAEAGVKTPLRVELLVYNTPQSVQAGEVIQAMAAEAGFDVRVTASEFGAVLAAVNRGEFELTLGGWSGLLDPDSNSYTFLHTGAPLNMARYTSPTADRLLEQARGEADPEKRVETYDQLWRQVQADLPIIYLWTTQNILGATRKVQGLTLLADGLLRVKDAHVVP